ncbi:hypothetical protein CHH80_09105 [Bacillus sp. 7504-2]|nr:hypothetical protein CHH80_09105 [Bacillus sp. 7504-2]
MDCPHTTIIIQAVIKLVSEFGQSHGKLIQGRPKKETNRTKIPSNESGKSDYRVYSDRNMRNEHKEVRIPCRFGQNQQNLTRGCPNSYDHFGQLRKRLIMLVLR